ncbi:hypothetical protein EN873_45010, partial [bacterium M00.F.Ca.ET.230.01.1.1]
MATLEQQIAQKQDELNRLKEKAKTLENGQKIVLGGMVLSVARKNPQFARQLLAMIGSEINRDTDKKRLENIIDELQGVVNNNQQPPQQPQPMHQTHPNYQ